MIRRFFSVFAFCFMAGLVPAQTLMPFNYRKSGGEAAHATNRTGMITADGLTSASVQGDTGWRYDRNATAGMVLVAGTDSGDGVWVNPASAIAFPDGEILYGTGSGVTSNPGHTFEDIMGLVAGVTLHSDILAATVLEIDTSDEARRLVTGFTNGAWTVQAQDEDENPVQTILQRGNNAHLGVLGVADPDWPILLADSTKITGDLYVDGDTTITGKLTVMGLIDPTGLELTPVAANPGNVAANTIWLDSLDGDRAKIGSESLAYMSEAGVTDGDKGDISVSGSGATWAIDDNAVVADMLYVTAPDVLLGRDTSGSGAAEEISMGAGLSMSGGALSVSAPGAGGAWGWLYTSSNQTGINAASDVTGLTVAVISGQKIHFEAVVFAKSSSSSGGIRASANGPTASVIFYSVQEWTGAAAAACVAQTAWDTYSSTANGPTTYCPFRLSGTATFTANGTFAVRIAPENTFTTDVGAGSYLRYVLY